MVARFTVLISDQMNEDIEAVVEKQYPMSKSDFIRRAVELYLIAHTAATEGQQLAFITPEGAIRKSYLRV